MILKVRRGEVALTGGFIGMAVHPVGQVGIVLLFDAAHDGRFRFFSDGGAEVGVTGDNQDVFRGFSLGWVNVL